LPWEETDQYIRSGHRNPDDFKPDSLRTITVSEEEGIKAVVGKPKGKDTMEVQSYLFSKEKDWTLDKAKAWFEKHREETGTKEHVSCILPFQVLEKVVDKPLRIKGIAMTSGISRNFNIYTPEELQTFANKLVSAPVYVEHVAVPNAVGKVTQTSWDGENLWYEAEIYESEIADKIRKGLIQHVSVGADYETLDIVDGKIPHGLHNAELSLVAVPGIPETNVQVLESLKPKEQMAEPIIAGEYVLGFYQDQAAFMPEHFRTVWLDQQNGVLAVMSKVREDPSRELCQAILFSKAKLWDQNSIRDWLSLHPDYIKPAVVSEKTEPVKESAPKMSEKVENTPEQPPKDENPKEQIEEKKQPEEQQSIAEKLLKKPETKEPMISVKEAKALIEAVLPSPMVERSWSLGPQRLCQELRGVIRNLESRSYEVTNGSRQG